MWTESLLFHTLPRPVGDFLENRWLPLMGECVTLLNIMLVAACTTCLVEMMPEWSARSWLFVFLEGCIVSGPLKTQ